MKKLLTFTLIIVTAVFLGACSGGGGTSNHYYGGDDNSGGGDNGGGDNGDTPDPTDPDPSGGFATKIDHQFSGGLSTKAIILTNLGTDDENITVALNQPSGAVVSKLADEPMFSIYDGSSSASWCTPERCLDRCEINSNGVVTLSQHASCTIYINAKSNSSTVGTSAFGSLIFSDQFENSHTYELKNTEALYVGGDFTSVENSLASNLAQWNGSSWNVVGSGISNGVIHAVAVDPKTGVLCIGGQFSHAGNVSGTENIACFNGNQWYALGNGVKGIVRAIAFDEDNGDIYVGGGFNIDNVPGATGIARWDSALERWEALGNGIDLGSGASNGGEGPAYVCALAIDSVNKSLYLGGNFGSPSGDNVNHMANWNIENASWSSMQDGDLEVQMYMDDDRCKIVGLVFDPDKEQLYVAGQYFISDDPEDLFTPDLRRLVVWDVNAGEWLAAQAFEEAGINSIFFDKEHRKLYLAGDFSIYFDRFAVYDMDAGSLEAVDTLIDLDTIRRDNEFLGSWIHTVFVDSDGSVTFGGQFNQIENNDAPYIAGFDALRSYTLGNRLAEEGPNNGVYALEKANELTLTLED
ncbi:MAG: hypothetical protein AAGA27_04880 [Pseudomonadota bacterium]